MRRIGLIISSNNAEINCLKRAIESSEVILEKILSKSQSCSGCSKEQLNHRQIKVLNLLLDGFKGNLNTSKWEKINKCSQDTAFRDISKLIELGVLEKRISVGRSTEYSLKKENGSPGRIRTSDQAVNSRLLYH